MRRLFLLLLLLMCCLGGCASIQARIQGGHQEGHGQDAAFDSADRLFNEKKYNEAITAYNKIAQESAGSERGARALYDVAFTHAFYDNPRRDYAQALQKFDEFLLAYPDNAKADKARNWRHILGMVLELKKENEHLSRSIEQLKKIDIMHEEQRKGK